MSLHKDCVSHGMRLQFSGLNVRDCDHVIVAVALSYVCAVCLLFGQAK